MHCRGVVWSFLALSFFALSAIAADRPVRKAPEAARTWTDSTGKYKLRATLAEYDVDGGQVKLKKSDGSVVTMQVDKLSEADQAWLKQRDSAAKPVAKTAADTASWPGWLGPNRDGKSPDTGLLKAWPEAGPKLLWKSNILGKGFSSVAVAGGMVYVTGEPADVLVLYAFDLDGNLKWKVPHGPAWTKNYPGARSTPTIDGNNLYLLSGTGVLGCYDAKSGKPKWSRNATEFGGSPGGWGYAESPLVMQNLVIFKPGGSACIVALDKGTGRNVWSSRGFSAGPEYSSCLGVTEGRMSLVVTGTNQGLVAVGARDGAMAWMNDFAAKNTANCPTPAYSDGYVFWANGYGKGGVCVKLTAAGASEAWRTREMDCQHGGYIIDKGYIYGNNGSTWTCLDLKTGNKMWQDRGVGKGSLCWADDMLYLFSENGGQAALATCSPDTFKIVGQVKVEGQDKSWAHPVVIGGRLYLRYETNLYCYDVRAAKAEQ